MLNTYGADYFNELLNSNENMRDNDSMPQYGAWATHNTIRTPGKHLEKMEWNAVDLLWRVGLCTTVRKDEIAPIESGACKTFEDIMFVSLEDIMITTLSKTIRFSRNGNFYMRVGHIILFPLEIPHDWSLCLVVSHPPFRHTSRLLKCNDQDNTRKYVAAYIVIL